MSNTSHLNLIKPDASEAIDVAAMNENLDILDEEVYRRIKTVNGIQADPDGDAKIQSVKFADNLNSESAQHSEGTFIIRTSGGEASISNGDAWAVRIMGNRVHMGYVPEEINMTVSPMERQEGEEPISATLDEETFRGYVGSSGTITLTYTTAWSANPESYGITVAGTPVAGDQIIIAYTKEDRGLITHATPSAMRSTGWNLYDHNAGYAHVRKYSDSMGFRVIGTYTALQYSETLLGEKSSITTANGMFNVPGDGYVWVTGGSSAVTCIIATWSDWTDAANVPDFEAYSETEIDLSGLIGSGKTFPYGLMQVGNVRDEINLNIQVAYNRIARMAYNATNLTSVIAAGYEYEADTEYIYYVRETPTETAINVDGAYTASDHGMEIFDGTTVPVLLEAIYGNNLKNKLERDVLTISQQTLTNAQQAQVRNNIGAAGTYEAVKYTEQQYLNDAQKTQARNNIGATNIFDLPPKSSWETNKDANDYTTSGVYALGSGCTNVPDTYIALYVFNPFSGITEQIAYKQTSQYFRECRYGTWSKWSMACGKQNVVNSISLSGTNMTISSKWAYRAGDYISAGSSILLFGTSAPIFLCWLAPCPV